MNVIKKDIILNKLNKRTNNEKVNVMSFMVNIFNGGLKKTLPFPYSFLYVISQDNSLVYSTDNQTLILGTPGLLC